MSIKTILVPVTPGPARLDRTRAAITLARRFGAHVDFAYLTAPVGMPAEITGRGGSAAYLAEATAINIEKSDGIRNELLALCQAEAVEASLAIVDGSPNDRLIERSRAADLLIVHPDHREAEDDRSPLHKTHQLLIEAGCPVLVLPVRPQGAEIGRHVVVAWKDALSATRALRAALPFLMAAEQSELWSCGRRSSNLDPVLAMLARHGITPRVTMAEGDDIAQQVLAHVAGNGADLLAIGAFGKGRWREQLLGGITQEILDDATVPVLTAA
jgi:nucleotide-binding universal stress UspA family protein